ncbi:SusC/RagA family TonB-linked outer membrane protein [Barnesiella intestinihominis]|uniref:SusC/RagA family TonB-linked outer membrane protein n=1 Tax=Barnesiella intestinihominis TaxID=487174 RepID=UPI003AB1C470
MNLLQKVERNHGKHSMKFRFCTRFFVSLILMCGYLGAMAQNVQISGVVKDVVGDPLIGVSVLVKGGTKGTSTDYNGFYTISAPADGTLVFSYVGMDTQEVKIGGSKKLDVTMTENGNYIDEVVVIGYGTVKKRDLTGSVSSVKSDDLNLAVAPSVAHALQGKAAGLVISQNSAQPGGGLDIRVRGEGSINGSKTPLYVVDGFPITELEQPSTTNERMVAGTQSVLNFINPADIESIEVLKDASATAIYGSRAANGVVLITTKRGKEGRTVVSYSGSYSIQQYTDNYDVYNLKEWMNAMNTATWDLWMYENNVYPYGNRTLQEAIDSPKNGVAYKLSFTDKQIAAAGEGTDWLDLITRNGSVQQHNVSVQGGSKNTNFMMSLNYYDNRGIIENSGMKRYSAKINVDQVINKYFKTGVNITASRIANDNTQLGAEEYEKSGMIRAAVQMNPNIPAQDEDGNYPVNPQLPTQPNPASLLLNTDKGLMDRILANAYVTYEPIKDLVFKFSMGMDRAHQSRKTYMPKETLFGGLSDGIATISENDSEKYLIETTGSYMKEFNRNHRINAVVGWSAEFNKDYYVSAGNNGFITDAFLWNSLQSGEGTKQVASGGSENKIYSAFARVGYTFMDRYLLTATFRADGASVFARNHKWGYFPSVALAWNMAEEPFMEPARSVVSMLKPRVSYGTVGNATGVTNNAFAAYYAQLAYNKQDNSQQTGVFLGRLENPDLKWETTKEFNVGLDFALFDGRIGGTFEFFERRITDLLTDKPLNTYHDLTFVSANIGTTGGRGFEFTLNTKNIVTKDFSWFSDITFSRVKNWWVEHTTDWKPSVYEGDNDPIRAIYSRKAIGIMQEGDEAPAAQPDLKPGQLIIEDLNGYLRDPETGDPVVRNGRFVLTGKPDGIIDDADNRLLGSSDPGFTIGFNNTFRYKGFDLNFNFYGSFDRVMMDPTRMAYGVSAWGMAQYGYNGLRCLDDRWMPDNPSTKNPSSFFSGSTYGYGDWFYDISAYKI